MVCNTISAVFRYRYGWQWADDSFAHYVRSGQVGKLSNCGHINDQLLPDVAYFGLECAKPFDADYLCELADGENSERAPGQKVLLPVLVSSIAAFPVPTVVCPARHFTHTFLAFDPASKCWLRGNGDAVSRSWDIYKEMPDRVRLMQYPPMMECDTGAQHVPYSLVCDHQQQCDDGSDESFCVFLPCPDHKPIKCLLSAEVCMFCLVNILSLDSLA